MNARVFSDTPGTFFLSLFFSEIKKNIISSGAAIDAMNARVFSDTPGALSREGRLSSPHTALAGAICGHSSEFFTLERANVGPWRQQASLL